MSTKVAAELVSRCFAARTAAHFAHLLTKSYSQHMALGDFYDDIAEGADKFIECRMGCEGHVGNFPAVTTYGSDPMDWLPELHTWISENRAECADGNTELQNLVDEILAVIDRAFYKLKFLK